MDWAASGNWNMFYLVATIFTFYRAYYSRHEQIQKITAYMIITYPIGMMAMGTEHQMPVYLLIDSIGAAWCVYLMRIDVDEPASQWCALLFLGMLAHTIGAGSELLDRIAYNLLYLAQLVALSTYGKRYGMQARSGNKTRKTRDDPFYRSFGTARQWLKLSVSRFEI